MTETDAYDILSDTFLTVLLASSPILGVALAVGLVIAFFQALTQIQEMTLTFVPKIAAIFVVLLIATPLIYSTVKTLSDRVFDLIASGTV
ncbi:MAG: flagellar biosynthetic protein FliQ [Pseudomonadota bacterium]|uniref:Flagellar biosynthetic protein FliQ n=1 Tax=Pseudooceanicola nitratireducens TaxID=517719 RepID=A0A1I1Q2M8_9RHOB|nr:flagellar biosynthetic protein FliQ [Pseudooceanicola nitratireducens]MEC7297104.1 flagellar biosynthetic protein FliQ [Pseudomonadota bacterium]MBY6159152.1 flagellar type III secretion system protein FliQ [Pseudooceanicola nitratireducens]MBY6167486.1 flagellar type III secretion system protein FliQ [Pseudooceanicola nitratireducens]MEC7795022.1 flagellar biosynthetic protein FliQ [Pseudomonadota bacterium]MEC8666948.1 flagellar biosynthetic protein FliQ [Pseudomonadota bacterium]